MTDLYEPPDDEDDARMRRAALGDTAEFGEIIRRHQGRIASFASRILGGDHDAAEDVTQETFLRLWRTRSTYQRQGRLTHYLLRIATNLCRDRQRADAVYPTLDLTDAVEIASGTPEPDCVLAATTLADAVHQALCGLPEAQRTVFVLSHYEQLSYRDIATLLKCPIGTVASRKSMAVETLRRRLRHHLED